MASFLKLQDVSKSYDSVLNAPPVRVLDAVSLEVEAGESLAIVGPSGSGKSTLLNIIGALDRPSSGQVFFQGEDLGKWNERALAAFRQRRLGFVFQAHHLLPQCTVLENVLVPALAAPQTPAGRQNALDRGGRLLERVGLGARRDHRPGQLSGGERQRAAVVRALINQPQLLLADEPTGALDRAASEGLSRLLLELNTEEKVTLILVTHAPELAQRMKRRCRILDGRLEPNF
ncbi:MAG: ABC transporter ATP-binding protein [Verrucomicrobiota bacterium]|jgi:ABC-type lipoprotein export system ATPase subunit